MPQLVFLDGKRMGLALVLPDSATLGRAADCSLVLEEPGVLERHAVLRRGPAGYLVEPAAPGARIAVNGRPPDARPLRHGDILSLGDASFLFSDDPSLTRADETRPDTRTRVISRTRRFETADAALSALRAGPREPLEALYKAGAALHSTLELDEVTARLLDVLGKVFSPDRAFVLLADDRERLRVHGERVLDAASGAAKIPRAILDEAAAQRTALRSEDPVPGIRSVIVAPAVKGDRLLGAITLDRLAARPPWTEDDLKLLAALADQAALAIDNVRRHEQEVSFSRSLIRLGESARALAAVLSEEHVLREAVGQVCRIFDCSKASLLLTDPKEAGLFVAASNCIERTLWPSIRIRPGEGYAGRVLVEARPLAVRDAPAASEGRRYETSSFALAPVLARASVLDEAPRPIGVVAVTDKTSGGSFSARDEELLGIFASQLGTALLNARLFEGATVDSLTRLHSRQFFDVRGAEEVRAAAARGSSLAVWMADLDHFKDKNDVYGHPAGDRILAEATALLKAHVPAAGFAARYGGEEFVAILPGFDQSRAVDLAEDVRRAVEAFEFNAPQEPLRCTLSIGVAVLRPQETLEAVVGRADRALYAAKRGGRNRVEAAR